MPTADDELHLRPIERADLHQQRIAAAGDELEIPARSASPRERLREA